MSRRYFGTDGVRGPYGGPVVNEDFAFRLGAAAAHHFAGRGGVPGGEVLIGRDPRRSGPALAAALGEGLAAAGLLPVSLGVLPTPALARAVRVNRAAFGAVVTASHNPAADNGIKFFGPEGAKLSDAEEEDIERRLDAAMPPRRAGGARIAEREGAVQDYIRAVTALLPPAALRGWTVALDAANGAAAATAPTVLRALGASVRAMGDAPDGLNINAGVGSEHPEALRALAQGGGARLGLALDGDGDRCLLVDEQGGVLDGDEILTVLAVDGLQRGRLAGQMLVVTVQSNLGVDAAVEAAGGRVVRTPVGDRHVAARMLAEGARLGGESSGHIICAEVAATGDGLVAALKVIEVMLATGKPLSALRRALTKNPLLSRALEVPRKPALDGLPSVQAAIQAGAAQLGPRGRVLVRYSGTEPKIRLLVEGPDAAVIGSVMASLESAVRADLG